MKHPFDYEVLYSDRKTTAIQITPEGTVRVRAPRRCPKSFIDAFLYEKEDWILKHLSQIQKRTSDRVSPYPLTQKERTHYIQMARDIFTVKTAYYAKRMHVTYHRISIREQKTRWGSCSSAGNLNFNWRLIFAPPAVLDYVVVHELAHRKEMNHSAAFYAIVEQVLPDYRSSQKWLRENGHQLWLRK